jgi:hypothetical protein
VDFESRKEASEVLLADAEATPRIALVDKTMIVLAFDQSSKARELTILRWVEYD